MVASPQRLLADALALPADERETLLRALIESLDGPANASDEVTSGEPSETASAAWDAEIERRAADDEGSDLDGPAVMRQLRAEILGR
jgi:hypothetical protein